MRRLAVKWMPRGRNEAAHAALVVLLATVTAAAGVCGCSDAPAPASAPACSMRLGDDPAFDLVLDGSDDCPGRVRLSLRVATGDAAAPEWSAAGESPLRVEGGWRVGPAGATREVVIANRGGTAVNLVGLEWTASGLDLGLEIDRLVHNGYQSWSYTGVEPIPERVGEQRGTARYGGDAESTLGEVPGVSWWWAALADADGRGLVAGADGGTVLKTYVAAERGRLRIVEGATGDAIELAPGESRRLDGLFVALGDLRPALDAYAAHVAGRHPPAAGARRGPLGGWGSWNLYYASVTAAALREEMAWAGEHLAPLGLTDFLLDDGYEPRWGAWYAAPRFGAELEALAAEESSRGLAPAIWVAPFYVDDADPTLAAHPDWFLRGFDGQLRLYRVGDGRRFAALDATHPEARSFVTRQLAALWSSGYRTFKLDFLYAGAIEGLRHEPVTALESYQLWMRTLREALPDAHLVGCGAPLLPSVGWVDSMRTGPDIAFDVIAPEPQYMLYASQARQTALRGPTDAWWALDPDVVLLRGAAIDDTDAWSIVVSAALAGGNYLLGDGRQAGELRAAMALDPEVLALLDGAAARPLDLVRQTDARLVWIPFADPGGETAVPHLWEKRVAGGDRTWLAVFAWQDDPYRAEIDLPQGAVEIVPPAAAGSPSTTRGTAGRQAVEVPRHGVRLFRWNARRPGAGAGAAAPASSATAVGSAGT